MSFCRTCQLSPDSVEVLDNLSETMCLILSIMTIPAKVILFYHRVSTLISCNSCCNFTGMWTGNGLSVATSEITETRITKNREMLII